MKQKVSRASASYPDANKSNPHTFASFLRYVLFNVFFHMYLCLCTGLIRRTQVSSLPLVLCVPSKSFFLIWPQNQQFRHGLQVLPLYL